MRCSFAGEGNCSRLLGVLREAMASEEYRPFFEGFEWPWFMPRRDEYAALVEAAGFVEATVRGENRDSHFPDVDALVRWIDQPSLVPFLPPLDPEKRGPFRDLVVARMIEAAREEDGRLFETFRRISVLARKRQ